MTHQEPASPRLADRLSALARDRFVGRVTERALFDQTLRAAEPPFVVLHVYGPGGIGKSTLLREYMRLAREAGRPVVWLDRDVEVTVDAVWRALAQALGAPDADAARVIASWPANAVLLIDTYERFEPLDAWLRDTLLPQIPANCLVVTGGRNRPAPAWQSDIAWSGLARALALRNLSPREGNDYLAGSGIPTERRSELVALTHGHPLALSLVVDLARPGGRDDILHLRNEPDLVRVLLERLINQVPDEPCRIGLQVCAIARLADLLLYLSDAAGDAMAAHRARVLAYRERYGVDDDGGGAIF